MTSTAQDGAASPAEAGRITTTLTPRTARELAGLRDSSGHTKSDLINRAISLYAFVTAQLDAGRELVVRDPAQQTEQQIQLL